MTPTTSDSLLLLNGIESLIQSIMMMKELLPISNIDNLIVEEVLLNNFGKSLGKKLHKIAVDA
jgi:hypothetical protein